MNLKKFTQKDRFGNMLSYEFEANVPQMTEIPPAFQPGPKGTDTIPSWLTPGENIVNAEASRIPGVQPMLDKLNEMGRRIQDEQGGPIPTYAQEGTFVSKITPEVLDALRLVESSGNPNAVSPVGASGPYQIMESTAQKPGFGVAPITLEDRFDENKSRNFAESYLKGIEKSNPNFTLDQILQSYHSGVGNVKKGNLGPEGKAYVPKINEAMNKEMPLVTYKDIPVEPGMMSAMAASNEIPEPVDQEMYAGMNLREVQRFERGIDDDIAMDSSGNVQSVNPNRIDPTLPETYADRLAKGIIRQDQYDNLMNNYNQAVKQNEAYKKDRKRIQDEEQEIKNKNIEEEIKKIENLIASNQGNKSLINSLTQKKANLQGQIKVTSSANVNSVNTANNIIKETDDAISNEYGFGAILKLNQQNPQVVEEEGNKVGDDIKQTVTNWFTKTFKNMFSGPELARMVLMYTGSRALGYNHAGSINFAAKQYIKRVDAAYAQRQKDVRDSDFIKAYTKESLDKYLDSGDRADLVEKPKATGAIEYGKDLTHAIVGNVQVVKLADKTQGIRFSAEDLIALKKAGYNIPDSYLKRGTGADVRMNNPLVKGLTRPVNKAIDNLDEIEKGFRKDAEFSIKQVQAGKELDADERIGDEDPIIYNEATQLYARDVRKWAMNSDETALKIKREMQEAMREYYRDYSLYKQGERTTMPTGIEAYYNKRMIRIKTGGVITSKEVGDTSPENLRLVENAIAVNAKKAGTRKERIKEFKDLWQDAKDDWKRIKNLSGSGYDTLEGSGWNAFMKWTYDMTLPKGNPDRELAEELARKNGIL